MFAFELLLPGGTEPFEVVFVLLAFELLLDALEELLNFGMDELFELELTGLLLDEFDDEFDDELFPKLLFEKLELLDEVFVLLLTPEDELLVKLLEGMVLF